MIKSAPIKFAPYLKNVIWGGEKICKYKGISQPEPNIGGDVTLRYAEGETSISKGTTLLIPSTLAVLTIEGKATLLLSQA